MSTQLELAITELEGSLTAMTQAAMRQSVPAKFGDNASVEFFVARANALGLSFLRQCARDGIQDALAFNEQYKVALRGMKVEEA